MSTTDAKHSRRPVKVTAPEIIDMNHDKVMNDVIAYAVGISAVKIMETIN